MPSLRPALIFYALSFGWVSLVALALFVAGIRLGSPGASLALAFLYMPAPLVAALIAERIEGRPPLGSFEGFRLRWRRLALVVILVTAAVYAVDLLLTALLGNVAGVPGVGELALSTTALDRRLAELLHAGAAMPALPSPAVLYTGALVVALAVGFTVNGLFGFGEEYGWRGFLMDELRPLGMIRANLLIGVAWGLWHAPLILMGFNYGPHTLLGIPAMCLFTTAFSFVLWQARERTGSVLTPAVLHGALNGFAGIFVLAVSGANPLVAAPVGLVGAIALGGIALGIAWRRRDAA